MFECVYVWMCAGMYIWMFVYVCMCLFVRALGQYFDCGFDATDLTPSCDGYTIRRNFFLPLFSPIKRLFWLQGRHASWYTVSCTQFLFSGEGNPVCPVFLRCSNSFLRFRFAFLWETVPLECCWMCLTARLLNAHPCVPRNRVVEWHRFIFCYNLITSPVVLELQQWLVYPDLTEKSKHRGNHRRAGYWSLMLVNYCR